MRTIKEESELWYECMEGATPKELEQGFEAGASFVQRWYLASDKLPPLGVDIICKEISGYDCYNLKSSKKRDENIVTYGITHWRQIEVK